MRRLPIPNLLLAAALALLLPLERTPCAGMGSPGPAASAAAPAQAGHACCCRPGAMPERPGHACPLKAPQHCLCQLPPPAALTSAFVIGNEAPSGAALAVHPVASLLAPAAIETAVVPALDVGSPPGPDDPGAHGLRAPPLSV